MDSRYKILAGAGVAVLLLISLIATTAIAQGPVPGRRNGGWGPGMMHGTWNTVQEGQENPGTGMPCDADGAFESWGPGMMGYGMMWHGWGRTWQHGMMSPSQCPFSDQASPEEGALTLEDAQAITEQFLANYGYDDLTVAEVMQFSQNFYVEVREASTGTGAMELLIDPYSGAVHPEPGPNMMWNTRYGHMGGWYRRATGDMTISEDEAIALAQSWLDTNMPGSSAGDEAEPFYGYYTIHTLADGEISGMLSVNGYTGRVWYHNWHGDFIDMTAEHGA
jgi:hypothetical protein